MHVEGRVNGQDFTIERSVRGRGKGKLTFQLDGADLTMAEIKLTQAEVDRHLAADMLMRAVFHGQADITALLEVRGCDGDCRVLGVPAGAVGQPSAGLPSSRAAADGMHDQTAQQGTQTGRQPAVCLHAVASLSCASSARLGQRNGA